MSAEKRAYRICRECGREVNVSCLDKHGKKYICPACAGEPWLMTRDWLSIDPRGVKTSTGFDTPQRKGVKDNEV